METHSLKKNANNNSPVLGTWKFTKKSAINEFQQVQTINKAEAIKDEYFIFLDKNKFQHLFVNEKGIVVKTLKGTWKTDNSKIKIVIFTKDNLNDQNVTMK